MGSKDQFKETKQYLSEIRRLTSIIENREMDKAKWETLACNITSKIKEDVVQTTPKMDKMGDCATEIVMLEQEIDVYKRRKRRIIQEIESLPDVNHVAILSMIYVQEMNTFDVADKENQTRRTAQRNLNAAYRSFERLYGKNYL